MSISGLTRRQITSKARKKERKNQPTNQPIKKKRRRRIEIPNRISNGKTNAAAYGSHSSIIISYHFVSIIMARFYPFPFDSFFCVCLSLVLFLFSDFFQDFSDVAQRFLSGWKWSTVVSREHFQFFSQLFESIQNRDDPMTSRFPRPIYARNFHFFKPGHTFQSDRN